MGGIFLGTSGTLGTSLSDRGGRCHWGSGVRSHGETFRLLEKSDLLPVCRVFGPFTIDILIYIYNLIEYEYEMYSMVSITHVYIYLCDVLLCLSEVMRFQHPLKVIAATALGAGISWLRQYGGDVVGLPPPGSELHITGDPRVARQRFMKMIQ